MTPGSEQPGWVTGGCHCGRVRFEVLLEDQFVTVHQCNCSICTQTGFLHLIVPKERFRLTTSDDALVEYRFNTGVARHLFCGVCGIKSFYVPRSNPDGYSVNLRCLDLPPGLSVRVKEFDGQHWEDNAAQLAGLTARDGEHQG